MKEALLALLMALSTHAQADDDNNKNIDTAPPTLKVLAHLSCYKQGEEELICTSTTSPKIHFVSLDGKNLPPKEIKALTHQR